MSTSVRNLLSSGLLSRAKIKNKFFILSALILLLTGCNAKIVGGSSITDIPSIVQSPSVPATLPMAGLTLSSISLRVGSLLTLTSASTDLSTATKATIDGTEAVILNKSQHQMQVFIMPGSTTGYVGVTTSSGIDYAASQVTVTQATAGVSYTQFGSQKMVASGSAYLGTSLDISSDGSTAAIGAPVTDSNLGGVWVYSRNGASWTEQAVKLQGSDASGTALQGYATALNADGNILLVGGAADNNNIGAAWIYTRSGSTWTQQGSKIVPDDASGTMVYFGISGDLSADGNTAIIGGIYDDNMVGAAWIYTRNGSSWTKQAKLIASDAIGTSTQGFKVALSADGNTALVGAAMDDNLMGAAWVYTRTGSTWTQQAKLIGTSHLGIAQMGYGVALSADGNTAAVAGPYDDNTAGAVWIFKRTGSAWNEEAKLLGTGNLGVANIGYSVAITADGNTVIAGGPNDNTMAGASWIFTRSGSSWTERTKLLGSDNVNMSTMALSSAVSADGSVMMCGGSYDNSFQGAVWAFGK